MTNDRAFWSFMFIIGALALTALVMLGLTAAQPGPYL